MVQLGNWRQGPSSRTLWTGHAQGPSPSGLGAGVNMPNIDCYKTIAESQLRLRDGEGEQV